MIFSIIFDTSGKSEIDQQFLGSFFAPFLNKGFNLAILHSSGKDDNLINLVVSRLSKIFLITYSHMFDNSNSLDMLHEVLARKIFLITFSDKLDNSNSLDTLHKYLA